MREIERNNFLYLKLPPDTKIKKRNPIITENNVERTAINIVFPITTYILLWARTVKKEFIEKFLTTNKTTGEKNKKR